MKKYVIINKRLKDYLYSLGFSFKEDNDKYNKHDKVYIFNDTDKLRKCIQFYTDIHRDNQLNIEN